MTFESFTFDTSMEVLYLVGLFDIHAGAPGCREDLLDRTIDFIAKEPNARWIYGGDGIENALKASLGDIYKVKMSPDEQVDFILNKLDPIWGKCVGAISGNHEKRTLKSDGISIVRHLSRVTGVPYGEDSYTVMLSLGRGSNNRPVSYVIHVHHGVGSSKTAGGKLNAALRHNNIVSNADVYITGHTHAQVAYEDKVFEIDRQNRQIKEHKRLYVVSGSYLDYTGYSEAMALAPVTLGSPVIVLPGHKKQPMALEGAKAHNFDEFRSYFGLKR